MLHGKIILVTGGSGLIGKAVLEDIRSKGGFAINLDVNVETDLEKFNCHCDITSTKSISTVLQEIQYHFGKIDGLVNNAYPRTNDWGTPFEEMPFSSWQKNIDLQLNSYANFCRLTLPFLRSAGGGSIVNMTSIYGVVGNDFTIYEDLNMEPPIAYSAIKGGLVNLSRFLASKYGKENIRVNCVSPGGIFDHQPEEFVKRYEHRVPLKRMGTPDDIAPAISFLLSDEARYVTGHNLIVDGGWTAI